VNSYFYTVAILDLKTDIITSVHYINRKSAWCRWNFSERL